jgi:acyl-CoA hydrolase/GNAT superfamily N-acetyltransferase
MTWRQQYSSKQTTPDEAVLQIPRGQHIYIGSGCAVPRLLVRALERQADHFADNTVVHLMTLGPAPYVDPRYAANFRHNAFFIGGNTRDAVREGRADFTPVFLSRIPSLIRSGRMPVEVALIQCSPPDRFGYVNLGVAVDLTPAAIEAAKLVIAEINPAVPVIHGAGFVHIDRIDAWIESDEPLLEHIAAPLDEVSLEIGRNVASLIDDGNTLQTGIGAIPDATLKALDKKRDLGLWTEMFSDGVLELIESGVINGRRKAIHPGKITSSFTIGSRRLFDFVDRNPEFTFHPSDYINDPIRIARQHRMVAINSALQVDLTGQVCADSIGTQFYSGIGGQVDFIRGASMCPGGKPIIALPSTAREGTVSRIAPILNEGAGVVTSRGDVRYIVTEYGVADLLGKSIRERAVALISVAHPDFRAELLSEAKERRYVFVDQITPQGTYPRRYEKILTTTDGAEILLRPVHATDEPKLSKLFYGVSENTIYKRFMHRVKGMAHEELQYYLDVNYQTNMVLVLETREGSAIESAEPEIVGVAQYLLDQASGYADIAFIVRDEWQKRGLGTQMFLHLATIAKENGVEGFQAEMLESNRGMVQVFHKSGFELKSSQEEDVYRMRIPFPDPDPKPIGR